MTQALLLIDIQNDYFDGGALPLVEMDAAAANAARLLDSFRARDLPRVHVQHLSTRAGATFFLPDTEGAEIHSAVAPAEGEPVVRKHFPNAFRDTALLEQLRAIDADSLTVCGAMSHMCIDASVRAAFDLGFTVEVAHDACATRDLTHLEHAIPAAEVHAAFMAALAVPYARVASTAELVDAR